MLYLLRLVVVVICVSGAGYGTSARAQLGPSRVSDVVVRVVNLQQTTPACTPALELGFFLVPPPNKVLMMTGFFWGASFQPGRLIETDMFITDGNPSNRRFIARISGTASANGLFSGIQTFPVPVPLFRGAFTHLCVENKTGGGSVLGTSTFQLYGFFAADN
jgi:hypothetical protein